MAKSKFFALTETDRCVACGVCMNTCPRKAITIPRGKSALIDELLCVGCGLCDKACPAAIITLVERNKTVNS